MEGGPTPAAPPAAEEASQKLPDAAQPEGGAQAADSQPPAPKKVAVAHGMHVRSPRL